MAHHKIAIGIALVLTLSAVQVFARGGGGGGGRGSIGSFGGGGGRPSMPSGGVSRPNMNMQGMNRPSFGNASARPMPQRPNPGMNQGAGGFSPGGTRPNVNRPDVGFPNVGGNRPGPGYGNVNRPNVNFPSTVNRPNLGGGNGNRPTTLPGNVERPSLGNAGRPSTLPGNISRPNVSNRPQHPIAGGNRPNAGLGNINIGNQMNIHNHPNWDHGALNRPGWGLNNTWQDHWHDHCIHDHFPWYNGCWHAHWGSNWYRPFAWYSVGWGLGAWTTGWGYGNAYYNPYYSADAGSPYDYSQPIVINNYAADSGDQTPLNQPPTAAFSPFDEGLAQFKSGQYPAALVKFNAALKQAPGDAVIHEVRALAQFAVGDYKSAAASLNGLLSSAPGMDWTTMSSLYGNIDDYTSQLRKLESFCKANPKDAGAFFVLAYHYLATDAQDDAAEALRVVIALQPKDATAKRMLDGLTTKSTDAANGPMPEVDLVGKWTAKAGDSSIELKVNEDSSFTWTATSAGKPATTLQGTLELSGNELSLSSKSQGAMEGSFKSTSADAWELAVNGSPSNAPPLKFSRSK